MAGAKRRNITQAEDSIEEVEEDGEDESIGEADDGVSCSRQARNTPAAMFIPSSAKLSLVWQIIRHRKNIPSAYDQLKA